MNCLSHLPSYSLVIVRTATRIFTNTTLFRNYYSIPAWDRSRVVPSVSIRVCNLELVRFHSTKRRSKTVPKLGSKKDVEREKDAFFVVRKGDVVGIYRSFSDCQAQIGSSVCDPPVSIYKGYLLPKESEDYLVTRGLKDAIYTISADNLKDGLFGLLTPCPIHEPTTGKPDSNKDQYTERSQGGLDEVAFKVAPADLLTNGVELDHDVDESESSSVQHCEEVAEVHDLHLHLQNSCTLEFDGASKGNPGKAGAGAILRTNDGNLICRLREGVGVATCNVAEYRAIILGLKYALKKGYTSIRVQGDSKLVCMQVQGLWKVRHKKISELFKEVIKLRKSFLLFEISHVLRIPVLSSDHDHSAIPLILKLNSEADAQANKATDLEDGHIEEECIGALQTT